VRAEIGDGGLLRRYREDDGLPGREGAFLACSFWLSECLARQGRRDEAREAFDRVMAVATPLGLFAEEADPETDEPLGTSPRGSPTCPTSPQRWRCVTPGGGPARARAPAPSGAPSDAPYPGVSAAGREPIPAGSPSSEPGSGGVTPSRSTPMASNVAEFILNRLTEWGVKRVYGYPGDGINGLLGAFHQVGDRLAFTQTRHEELAAFAACAHAKYTGELGVCMATSGPGAIHLLNGLYDAKLDHQPVLAIVGQQKRMSLGAHYQQEVDLQVLFKDVAAEYCITIMTEQQAAHVIDQAVRTALASRSVTAVIIPEDVQEASYQEPPRTHGAVQSQVAPLPRPHVVPAEEDLRRAADVLNAGSKVAILIGQGARNAEDEVMQLADVLGCAVAKALNGRDVLDDTLPFVTGSIGLLGTKPSNEMIEGCDTLLMVGTNFPYSEWLPEPGQARGVQIDLSGKMIGMRYPMEVTLVGDSRDTLRALLPLLRRKQDRSWREHLEHEVARWWEILDDRATQSADPINPQLVFHELSPRLPDGAILSADSGSATNWWARHLKLRKGMKAALSGTLATMCPAVPYALAAKMAFPDRPVIAALGDGAMQMLGINALIDIAHYWEQEGWADPRCVVVVLNNGDLNQVTWEQRVMAGDRRLDASQLLPAFDFARYAQQLRLEGIRVESPDQVGPGWERALNAGRPAVLDVVTDPEVPPLPPHIRFEQAKELSSAIMAGDPAAMRMTRQSLKGKLVEFVNR
jgi:pyruvate dehydrogenase (quinone)